MDCGEGDEGGEGIGEVLVVAKFRDFAEAVLGFLHKTVPQRFDEFSSSITDNFRVIDPKDFRILA